MFLQFNFSKGETLSNRSGEQMKSRSEGMEALVGGGGEAGLRQELWQRQRRDHRGRKVRACGKNGEED